jgi:hypothetical protein
MKSATIATPPGREETICVRDRGAAMKPCVLLGPEPSKPELGPLEMIHRQPHHHLAARLSEMETASVRWVVNALLEQASR